LATPEELANRYLQMSRQYIRQAQEELDKGDLSQATEKAWGASAESLKSIAAQRDWNHKSHGLLRDMATQLYMEFGLPRIIDLFGLLENAHTNYYEHRWDRDEVQLHIDRSRELLEALDVLRAAEPRRFTPANREQERRLQRLTQCHPDRVADAALDISTLPPVEPEG
jgi:uncharacterized protein (UPF0332 family)